MNAGVRHISGANLAVQCCGTPIGVQQGIVPTVAVGPAVNVMGSILALTIMETMEVRGGQNLHYPTARTFTGKRAEQFLHSIGQNTDMRNGFLTDP